MAGIKTRLLNVLLPFWNLHLEGETPASPIPPVLAFDMGLRRWRTFQNWPAGRLNQPAPRNSRSSPAAKGWT
jgi:hypothetical protein